MAKNTYLNNAADGMAEDLIRTITQLGCAESHAKTLYHKAVAEMENGLVDIEDKEVFEKHTEKIDTIEETISEYAEARREAMAILYEMYGEKGDETWWCQIKHLLTASYTAYESYQASDNDPALLGLAHDINRMATKALSMFLGAEVTDCAACLGDYLKAGDTE